MLVDKCGNKLSYDTIKSVAIVIPSYNEEYAIGTCLGNLINAIDYASSIYPANYHIVISDSSTDSTPDIVKLYDHVTLLDVPKRGISRARDTGTLYAISDLNSDIIISNDADTIATYDWLYKIITHFHNDKDLIGVTGIYKDMNKGFYESITTDIVNNIFIGLGGNTAFKSYAYLQIGGYNTKMSNTEDVDLWNRLKKLGKTIFDKDVYVLHNSGYRWRAGTAYPLSIGCAAIGYLIPSLSWMKFIGAGIGGYELIKHGNKLKEIPYNNTMKLRQIG